jgi:hypothetical protein
MPPKILVRQPLIKSTPLKHMLIATVVATGAAIYLGYLSKALRLVAIHGGVQHIVSAESDMRTSITYFQRIGCISRGAAKATIPSHVFPVHSATHPLPSGSGRARARLCVLGPGSLELLKFGLLIKLKQKLPFKGSLSLLLLCGPSFSFAYACRRFEQQ